ncbi:unnamed protein product, partial [Rotaria sp. Silwood2]
DILQWIAVLVNRKGINDVNNNLIISIRIRSTDAVSNTTVQVDTTIFDIISYVCQQNGLGGPENYYLLLDDHVLENSATVTSTNLQTLAESLKMPELCLKTSYLLKSSPDIFDQVIFTPQEKLNAFDILDVNIS